jgi:hypothetical protein
VEKSQYHPSVKAENLASSCTAGSRKRTKSSNASDFTFQPNRNKLLNLEVAMSISWLPVDSTDACVRMHYVFCPTSDEMMISHEYSVLGSQREIRCPILMTISLSFLDSKSFQACDLRIANSLLFSTAKIDQSLAILGLSYIIVHAASQGCGATIVFNVLISKQTPVSISTKAVRNYGVHRHRLFNEES